MLGMGNKKRSVSPPAIPDLEMVIGRAHSELWESNARSKSSRTSSGQKGDIPEDPERPVLPRNYRYLTGPGISGTGYDAYLLNSYRPRSFLAPGAASHTRKSGCLLASRIAGSREFFLLLL